MVLSLTWQTAEFGRVYATYGGIFITVAFLVWKVDRFKPDHRAISRLNAFTVKGVIQTKEQLRTLVSPANYNV